MNRSMVVAFSFLLGIGLQAVMFSCICILNQQISALGGQGVTLKFIIILELMSYAFLGIVLHAALREPTGGVKKNEN